MSEIVIGIVERVLEGLKLTTEAEGRLVENTDKFSDGLKKLIIAHSAPGEVKKAHQEYGYFSGYTPNTSEPVESVLDNFEAQIRDLDKAFNCGTDYSPDWIVAAHAIVPSWVEKFFAQFPWRHLASTYPEALDIVLKMLVDVRKPAERIYQKESEKFIVSFQLLSSTQGTLNNQELQLPSKTQKGVDVVAMPGQLGLRHSKMSVRNVRQVLSGDECGMSAFSVALALITHPDRLKWVNDGWIDCPGDEVSPRDDNRFTESPYFEYHTSGLCYDTEGISQMHLQSGSATFYIPPYWN